jgi:mercuric ion transport protein
MADARREHYANKLERIADGAGVVGAVLAALCCAGAPIVLSVLSVLGLSFLRNDAILVPFMSLALLIALWGFWVGRRLHGSSGPLLAAVAGAIALVAGVVFIHGFPAKQVIGLGAIALVAATVWNAYRRRSCAASIPLRHVST